MYLALPDVLQVLNNSQFICIKVLNTLNGIRKVLITMSRGFRVGDRKTRTEIKLN